MTWPVTSIFDPVIGIDITVYVVHNRYMIAFLLIGTTIVAGAFLAMALNTIHYGEN